MNIFWWLSHHFLHQIFAPIICLISYQPSFLTYLQQKMFIKIESRANKRGKLYVGMSHHFGAGFGGNLCSSLCFSLSGVETNFAVIANKQEQICEKSQNFLTFDTLQKKILHEMHFGINLFLFKCGLICGTLFLTTFYDLYFYTMYTVTQLSTGLLLDFVCYSI